MLLEVIFSQPTHVGFQIGIGNYTFDTPALQQIHASEISISNFAFKS